MPDTCKLFHCRCGCCGQAIAEDGGCGCDDNKHHPVADLEADLVSKLKGIIEGHIRVIHSNGDGDLDPSMYEELLAAIEEEFDRGRDALAEVERLRDRLAKRRETTHRLLCLCRASRVSENAYCKPSRALADLERSDRFSGVACPNPAITMLWAANEIGRLRKWERPDGFPEVVCLCGSTRFMDAFHATGWQLTLDGYIVLTVGVCKHAEDHGGEALGQDVADKLDELHRRKIDLAGWVMVVNVGGYIGESTRAEIKYAKAHGKMVVYLEETGKPKD